MKKTLGFVYAVGAVAAFAGPVSAADLYTPPPHQQVYASTPAMGWTGLYLGGFMGGAWGASNLVVDGPGGGANDFNLGTTTNGVFGGGQIGYDIQVNNFVFGIVGDLALAAIDGQGSHPAPPSTFRTDYDWISTIRGRAGWLVTPDHLLYAHGGLALADINFRETGGAGPASFVSQSGVQTGWTLGVGGEWRIRPNVSLFAEYAYMDFGSRTLTSTGPTVTVTQANTLHTIKLGANFRLN